MFVASLLFRNFLLYCSAVICILQNTLVFTVEFTQCPQQSPSAEIRRGLEDIWHLTELACLIVCPTDNKQGIVLQCSAVQCSAVQYSTVQCVLVSRLHRHPGTYLWGRPSQRIPRNWKEATILFGFFTSQRRLDSNSLPPIKDFFASCRNTVMTNALLPGL